MKVIVAGSRSLFGTAWVEKAVGLSGFEITEVVSGRAPGIDQAGETWAKFRGIPIKAMPARWNDLSHPDRIVRTNTRGEKYDARAGARRNLKMAQYADALIAIWDGKSRGTRDMIKSAQKLRLKVYVLRTDKPLENAPSTRPVKVIKAS